MYAHHMNQFNIAKRIVGSWLGKSNRLRNVRIELVDTGDKAWQYRLNAYGYTIDLYIHKDGGVFARLWIFGSIGATASTLAGFISLLKNCKRWASETQPVNNTEGK